MLRSLLAAALILLVLVVPAEARKPPRQTLLAVESSIVLDNPAPRHGDQLTYSVTSTAGAWTLWVECRQGERLIYWAGGITHTAPTSSESWALDSRAWVNGGAECIARILSYDGGYDPYNPNYIYSLAFSAAP